MPSVKINSESAQESVELQSYFFPCDKGSIAVTNLSNHFK